MPRIEIIDYERRYKECFKALNCVWIDKYFRLEPTDEQVLDHPEETVIGQGGFIFFARIGGAIVGTCAMLKVNDTVYEIAKMSVHERYRGLGIGNLLMKKAIGQARKMKLHKLVLYSNTKLHVALNMYIKFGFYMVPKTDFHNHRANLKMELSLIPKWHLRTFRPNRFRAFERESRMFS